MKMQNVKFLADLFCKATLRFRALITTALLPSVLSLPVGTVSKNWLADLKLRIL